MNPNIKLLVDSGLDINFIKLSSLKYEIIVYEPTEHILTGFIGHVLHSLGTVTLTIQIKQEKCTAMFQVVHFSFPALHDGILGKPFIIGLETVVNYKRKELILTGTSNMSRSSKHSENSKHSKHSETLVHSKYPVTLYYTESSESLISIKSTDNSETQNNFGNINTTIQPRKEALIAALTPNHQKGETILVPAQTIGESVMCSYTINK